MRMLFSSRGAWHVFIGVCVAVFIVLALRAWPLRLLYMDAAARAQVQTALIAIADGNGWLLSDLSVRSVSSDSMMIMHRMHQRGWHDDSCFIASLPLVSSDDLRSCDPS